MTAEGPECYHYRAVVIWRLVLLATVYMSQGLPVPVRFIKSFWQPSRVSPGQKWPRLAA